MKKRRPPSIPSVHICTKLSPCLHFGHGSLRLSYCRRGVSLVNSLVCCGGNSNTGSGKESGTRGPLNAVAEHFQFDFHFPLNACTRHGHPSFTHFTSYSLLSDFTSILASMILPIVSQHLLRLQCLDMLHLALPHSLCTPTPDFVRLL